MILEQVVSERSGVSRERLRAVREALVEGVDWVIGEAGIEYTAVGEGKLVEMGVLLRVALAAPAQGPRRRHFRGVVLRRWGNPRLLQVSVAQPGAEALLVNVIVHENTDWNLKQEIPVVAPEDQGLWQVGCGRPRVRGRMPNGFRWDRFLQA